MKMDIQFKTFSCSDPEYKEEYALRNEVLRHPLGLDLKDEDLSRDQEDIHLGGFVSGTLAAFLLLHPLGDGVYQELSAPGTGYLSHSSPEFLQ